MSAAVKRQLRSILGANILKVQTSKEDKLGRNDLFMELAKDPRVTSALTTLYGQLDKACPDKDNCYRSKDPALGDFWYVVKNWHTAALDHKKAVRSFIETLLLSAPFSKLTSSGRRNAMALRQKFGIETPSNFSESKPERGGESYIGQPTPSDTSIRHETQKSGDVVVPSNLSEEMGKGELEPKAHPDAFMSNQSLPIPVSIHEGASADAATYNPSPAMNYATKLQPTTATTDTKLMNKFATKAASGYKPSMRDNKIGVVSTMDKTKQPMAVTYATPENKIKSREDSMVEAADSQMTTETGAYTLAGQQQLNVTAYLNTGQGTGGKATMGSDPNTELYLDNTNIKGTTQDGDSTIGDLSFIESGQSWKKVGMIGALLNPSIIHDVFSTLKNLLKITDDGAGKILDKAVDLIKEGLHTGSSFGEEVIKTLDTVWDKLSPSQKDHFNEYVNKVSGKNFTDFKSALLETNANSLLEVQGYKYVDGAAYGLRDYWLKIHDDSLGWVSKVPKKPGEKGPPAGQLIGSKRKGDTISEEEVKYSKKIRSFRGALIDMAKQEEYMFNSQPMVIENILTTSRIKTLLSNAKERRNRLHIKDNRGQKLARTQIEKETMENLKNWFNEQKMGREGSRIKIMEKIANQVADMQFDELTAAMNSLQIENADNSIPLTLRRNVLGDTIPVGFNPYSSSSSSSSSSSTSFSNPIYQHVPDYEAKASSTSMDIAPPTRPPTPFRSLPNTDAILQPQPEQEETKMDTSVAERLDEIKQQITEADKEVRDLTIAKTETALEYQKALAVEKEFETKKNQKRSRIKASTLRALDESKAKSAELQKQLNEREKELKEKQEELEAKQREAEGLKIIIEGTGKDDAMSDVPPRELGDDKEDKKGPEGKEVKLPEGDKPLTEKEYKIDQWNRYLKDNPKWLTYKEWAKEDEEEAEKRVYRDPDDIRKSQESKGKLGTIETKYNALGLPENWDPTHAVEPPANPLKGPPNVYTPLLRLTMPEGNANIVNQINESKEAKEINRYGWLDFNNYEWEANEETDNNLHALNIIDETRRFYAPLDKDELMEDQAKAATEETYNNVPEIFHIPERTLLEGDSIILDTRGDSNLRPYTADEMETVFHDVYLDCWADIPKESAWNKFTPIEGSQIYDSMMEDPKRYTTRDNPLLAYQNNFIVSTLN